jgi:hypothetical protein
MISEEYLNIVQYEALEKKTTKIIKEIRIKERQEKQVRRVYNSLTTVKRVAHRELKKE